MSTFEVVFKQTTTRTSGVATSEHPMTVTVIGDSIDSDDEMDVLIRDGEEDVVFQSPRKNVLYVIKKL